MERDLPELSEVSGSGGATTVLEDVPSSFALASLYQNLLKGQSATRRKTPEAQSLSASCGCALVSQDNCNNYMHELQSTPLSYSRHPDSLSPIFLYRNKALSRLALCSTIGAGYPSFLNSPPGMLWYGS